MVVTRHLIYQATKISDPSLAGSRLTSSSRSDGSWIRGRNGSVLVWLEAATGLQQHVVPGRQIRWRAHPPGQAWLLPPSPCTLH